jgi:subtilisin family serine protease
MISRFGVGTALVATAMTALAPSSAGASTPHKARGAATGAAAAIQQVYTPRVDLPGDASTAGVQADPDNWLVNARAGAESRALARRFGGRTIGFRDMGAFVIRRDRARAFAAALRSRGLLRSAGPNVIKHRMQAPPAADPLTPGQWWRPAVVSAGTPTPPPDPAMKLGLVDSMPDLSHPEWAGSNFSSLGAGTVPPETGIGHGTATASVAAAPVNNQGIIGIWPGMVAVNAPLPPQGISCADSVNGIVAVLQQGAKVINMSYGSESPCDAEFLAVEAAVGLGAIPVASAGNELAQGNPAEFPASYPHVLTIAAINQSIQPTNFSNANAAVDLGAPGENVLGAIPVAADTQDGNPDGYTALAGTSFSSPIVAAAATWVRAARPDLQPDQVAQAIRLSAVDIAPQGFDTGSGFGMLNIDRALAMPANQIPPHEGLEPNDEIAFVDGSIKVFPRAPAVFGGKRGVRGAGTLDLFEDPADVYRIILPAHRSVLVRVKPFFGDTDVAVYDRKAKALRQTSRILKRSRHPGSKTDAVTIRNRGAQRSAFLAIIIHRGARFADAGYDLRIQKRG